MTDDTGHSESPDLVTSLWRRVKNHRIAQWTVGYVALAYGIQHAIILTSESFEWPNAIARVSMLLLALGLPIAITLAWYHGERASRRFSAGELSIMSMLLVIGTFLFYVFARPSPEIAANSAIHETRVAEPHRFSLEGQAVSLAVLPFLNLSPDKDQEFFSDGMTEEITAALAKVPDLRVVARTSAFEFKGKNIDIETIGRQLHATHLIEGSVRKAGNRLRITAQLIKADDGTHVWAEDYDRDLTDVFAIQEDIARAITTSLHMTLGLKPGENLVSNRNIGPADYQEFLRARNLIFGRGRQNVTEATAVLEKLVARNPDYAPAWAQLGALYYFVINTSPELAANGSIDGARRIAESDLSKADAASRRAIQLDPTYSGGVAVQGFVLAERGNFLAADMAHDKAFSMDPTDPQILNSRMLFLTIEGYLKEAAAVARQLQTIEPYVPALNANTATVLWVTGDTDAAISLAKSLPESQVNNRRGRELARAYASLGRYQEAADFLDKSGQAAIDGQTEAARLLRMAPNATGVQKSPYLSQFSWVYLYTDAPERALELYERDMAVGFFTAAQTAWIWHSSYAPLRKTERFKKIVRHLGLPDLWRTKGWPPQCHPTTGDDFECS